MTLLEQLLESPQPADRAAPQFLEAFLSARTVGEALEAWLGPRAVERTPEEIALSLNRDIAEIDRLLNRQINAVLHHPQFQRLEATWRSLDYLTRCVARERDAKVLVRVLNVSWRELERDLERAAEFDQSELFKKVYSSEFDTPGGTPYGLLIGDYEIHPRPNRDHPHDDIATLERISGVAAAAFCPFIAAAAPSMFGLDEFTSIEQVSNLARGFQLKEFVKWRSLRDSDDGRFIGLTLPRVLMRTPYEEAFRDDGFSFREDVTGPRSRDYLWGNASFAFAEIVVRAFASSGWLADLRGVRPGYESGGIVTQLPVQEFRVDRPGVAPKSSTDACLSEDEEAELARLGFIPLCHCKDTRFAAFFSNQSIQKPKTYDREEATQSARLSAMLQYTLCVSRFAHYLKVIARDKIGQLAEPEEFQRVLEKWIMQYVTPVDDATPEVLARRPLREASIVLERDPFQPGRYQCVFRMMPHYQLDEMSAVLRLRTNVPVEPGVA